MSGCSVTRSPLFSEQRLVVTVESSRIARKSHGVLRLNRNRLFAAVHCDKSGSRITSYEDSLL